MSWEGERIKALAKERGISLTKLADLLEVSRQSINDWIKGQVPKGTYLVNLSGILDVSPNYFFSDQLTRNISVPLHRTRGVARVTRAMRNEAFQLAEQYEKLFKWAPDPGIVPTLRVDSKDKKNVTALADEMRELSGIKSYEPMDYEHTFSLLHSLNIVTIFRQFPLAVKGYAFYSKIHRHRVVFVNNDTNVLDLIFPLLHEAIHAISDDEVENYNETKEKFCDSVANLIQFPEEYVLSVYKAVYRRKKAIQINLLKEYSSKKSHSIFGIVERLKDTNLKIESRDVGGANSNLRKEFPTIGDILFKEEDSYYYIDSLKTLSPLFIELVSKQIDKATTRKVGEWLGLESPLDVKQAIGELRKISHGTER